MLEHCLVCSGAWSNEERPQTCLPCCWSLSSCWPWPPCVTYSEETSCLPQPHGRQWRHIWLSPALSCFLPGCCGGLQTAQLLSLSILESASKAFCPAWGWSMNLAGWLLPLHGEQRAQVALMASATWVPGEAALLSLPSKNWSLELQSISVLCWKLWLCHPHPSAILGSCLL